MRRRPSAPLASLVLAAVLAAALGLTSCSGSDGAGRGERVLTVYAAASLAATFEELAGQLEEDHEGVEVRLSFGGSADLATQLQEGADADVLATADTATMDLVVADDLVAGEPRPFATNTLQVVVPRGNPAGVQDLADVTGGALDLVVCAPQVPCGAAAVRMAEAAGVSLQPVSEEQAVTDVLGKVLTGEADAGLVYVTDVAAAGAEVEGIDVPQAAAAANTSQVAVLADAEEPDLAAAFVELLTGPAGRAVLRDAGFGPP